MTPTTEGTDGAARPEGRCDAPFGAVGDAFAGSLEGPDGAGAACAVVHRGRLVVDLWGGTRWERDSATTVFSCTKGAAAACVNLLLAEGELDVDAPVTRWWPEFGAAGKGGTTVGMALAHQAGVPVLDRRPTVEEIVAWDPVVEMVAAQAPEWEPGTAHGYHAVTWGWIAGELVRRATGQSVGALFQERFAEPLDLHWWIGLPAEAPSSVVPILDYPGGSRPWDGDRSAPLMVRALGLLDIPDLNRSDMRAAEIPAGGGIADARSMARFYAALPEVLGPQQTARARTTRTSGADRVLQVPGVPELRTEFGLGFMVGTGAIRLGSPTSFGHNGAGGSMAFVDPEHDLAFGYVPRQMLPGGDSRAADLVRAAYRSIGVEAA